jgi:GMP synthase-like glutamine amidotransferase
MATSLVVEHSAAESSYVIGEAVRSAGVSLERCRVYAGEGPPRDAGECDGLIIMGGPMSAGSDAGFATRKAEVALIEDAVVSGIPVLGVCLGAQLLAVAAGAAVYPGGRGPEVGWAPVSLSRGADDDPLFAGLPPSWTVLHWHRDTFDLPPGAVHLASSERYTNQAFRLGDNAWGVQFHIEVDRAAVEAFALAFPDEAATVTGGVTGGAADAALATLQPLRDQLCSRFAELVAASRPGKDAVTLRSGNSVA